MKKQWRLMIPKTKTYRSIKYLTFIRSLPCSIQGCGYDSEAHHIETGGIGMKGSDLLTIPLCRYHHSQYHSIGRMTFCDKYNIDKWEVVAKCTEKYIMELEEEIEEWKLDCYD